MILSAIAAMARNRVIGKDNKLPWHLPADMKFFREKTQGKIMIMGRKTFESFDKPLPKRFHIVISRGAPTRPASDLVHWVQSLNEAIAFAASIKDQYPEEVFVIGGGEIYSASMNVIDRLYLTVIEQDFVGDTQFPIFDESRFDLCIEGEGTDPLPFTFRRYDRRIES